MKLTDDNTTMTSTAAPEPENQPTEETPPSSSPSPSSPNKQPPSPPTTTATPTATQADNQQPSPTSEEQSHPPPPPPPSKQEKSSSTLQPDVKSTPTPSPQHKSSSSPHPPPPSYSSTASPPPPSSSTASPPPSSSSSSAEPGSKGVSMLSVTPLTTIREQDASQVIPATLDADQIQSDHRNGYSQVVVEMSDLATTRDQHHLKTKTTDNTNDVNDDVNRGDDDNNDNDDSSMHTPPPSLCFMHRLNRSLRRFLNENRAVLKAAFLLALLAGYLVYFGYCMYYQFGGEPSVRLLVGTIIGLLVIGRFVQRRFFKCSCGVSRRVSSLFNKNSRRGARLRNIARRLLYALCVAGALGVLVEVSLQRPQNMVCLSGLLLLILVSFFISHNPEKINWHAVFWGMSLQFWFAVLITRTTWGMDAFSWLSDRFVEFLRYSDDGSKAVFGKTYLDHRFVFQLMPTIIFFNAMISVFYYLGLVQTFIATFGKFLSWCLGTSPIECVNAASNLFLTISEAPILIKPFMLDITSSELFAVITGGFASIAGSLFYAFAAYGAPINHILAASVMSAPAALAFAKLIYPDDRKPTVKAQDAYNVDVRQYGSMLGAFSSGASEGLTMAGYVVINLLIYVAALSFLDSTLLWFTERAGLEGFTFSKLVSYVLYPVTYLMGFDIEDCLKAGRLLGVKILTTTTLTYMELGTIITNGEKFREYTATHNDSWTSSGDDIFLEATNTTLVGGVLSERSGVLATYMMCGLSNLGAVGIAIGAFSSLAPSRTMEVIRQTPMALLAGNFASFSTACVAGLLYTG